MAEMTDEIRFIDTTIRDGVQSLWALNMRTKDMLPALPHLDSAGFDQMEFFSPASRMKKFVRHLRENPWDWIREGSKLATRTPLRWHGPAKAASLSGEIPTEVGELLISKVVDLGIRHTRMGDNWNNAAANALHKTQLERLGMRSVINLIYSVSPKHTDEYFVEKARDLAALQPWRLCLKDVGGLLTPERTRDLLPKVMAASPGVAWEFHGHCSNGLGPLNAMEAARAGVKLIHTAVPPLANGTSQPAVGTLSRNLLAIGFASRLDEEHLRVVTAHFTAVADREGFPKGTPLEFDHRLYHHQVPGGMISNLRHQLELAGMAGKLDETLEETGRVRAEFGYPIMVTPLSQFVATQAAINVIVGDRYAEVTDSSIEYALGRHGGHEAVAGMDPQVLARILDRPRARELAARQLPDPSLKELRAKYGKRVSDEDLILRAIVGDDASDAIANPPAVLTAQTPLIDLVKQLLSDRRHRFVTVHKGGTPVVVVRRNSDSDVR